MSHLDPFIYKVQFRNVFIDYSAGKVYGDWLDWNNLGTFGSIQLAMNEVLRSAYKNVPNATIDNFRIVEFVYPDVPIYEVVIEEGIIDWQFRFLKLWNHDNETTKESPWKIGLNDD